MSDDKIKVFDSDDESLKLLGELLSNETSRKIIRCLIEKEMYTNELATKLDMRVSLVIHHLKKLEKLGLVTVSKKKIVRRGQNHRYFKMSPHMFLSPNFTKSELEERGIFKKIFNESVKYTFLLSFGLLTYSLLKKFFKTSEPLRFSSEEVLVLNSLPEESLIFIPMITISAILLIKIVKKERG